MAWSQMIRELVGLEVDLASVDINSGYATCSKLRNKSQTPDTAKENNLSLTPASNNMHDDEAATSLNLCSWPVDSLELITLSNTSQNSTRIWCHFHLLWNCFIDYFSDRVLDSAFIYTGDVPFQYNEQEGMYT